MKKVKLKNVLLWLIPLEPQSSTSIWELKIPSRMCYFMKFILWIVVYQYLSIQNIVKELNKIVTSSNVAKVKFSSASISLA